MVVDTKLLVPMTDANQNFSKVTRLVDECGSAVILKNNRPRYAVVNFDEYDSILLARQARQAKLEEVTATLLAENAEALAELAK